MTSRRWARNGGVLLGVFLLLAALVMGSAPLAMASDSAPYRATVFTRGYDTSKVVTLSFDSDWPTADNAKSRANLTQVLQVLASNKITAAFGLTGRFVENNQADAKKIVAAGHKVINHSYNHPDFMTLTQAQRWAQLDKAEAAYRAAGISSAGWFRAPYGSGRFDPGLNRDLALHGYYISFDWTFDTTGYEGTSWSKVSSRIAQYTVPGAILVMHLSAPSTDPENLQAIINQLRSMGYGFVSPYQATTKGAIRGEYLRLGGPAAFGAATTGEQVATTSGTAVQWFQGGRIYWSSASGAHEVHGAILGEYRRLGTVTSFLRFPLTDEQPAVGGRRNQFQGGWIYWSSASGAHEVHGAIATKWRSLGSESGFLGYPVSDEVGVTGGRASQFQGGNIYWSSPTSAHEVHGAILTRYLSLGGSGSRLGLPVSDEFAVSGGRRSNFLHGAIVYSYDTHTTTVIYS